MRRSLVPLLGLLASCGPVPTSLFVPDLSGSYAFSMRYGGNCATEQNPGVCSVSPVVLLQSQTEVVVQPLGAGTVEKLVVVFASDGLQLCDLQQATLTFAGVFDGQDIDGVVSGTMRRTGFGDCSIQEGQFSLNRIP